MLGSLELQRMNCTYSIPAFQKGTKHRCADTVMELLTRLEQMLTPVDSAEQPLCS